MKMRRLQLLALVIGVTSGCAPPRAGAAPSRSRAAAVEAEPATVAAVPVATSEVSAPAATGAPAPSVAPERPPRGRPPARSRVEELGRIVAGCAPGDPLAEGGGPPRADACSFHGAIRAVRRLTETVCIDARTPCTAELQARLELSLADAPAAGDERCPSDPGGPPSAPTSTVYLTLPARLAVRDLALALGETVCGYVDQHDAPYGCASAEARLSRASGDPIVAYGTASTPSFPGLRLAPGREQSRWSSDGSVHVELSALLWQGGKMRELPEGPTILAGGGGDEYEIMASARQTRETHVYECARPVPVVSFSIVKLRAQ